MNEVRDQADKDTLSLPQRAGEGIFVVCMLLLFAFLLYHQAANTGFFTEKFGTFEMFWLYGPILFGISAPALRAWTGQRNPARPFEAPGYETGAADIRSCDAAGLAARLNGARACQITRSHEGRTEGVAWPAAGGRRLGGLPTTDHAGLFHIA